MPYKWMYAFIDESDSLCHGRGLVIGAWMTAYADDWSWRIWKIRQDLEYPCELHFHKISRDARDRRFRAAKAVAQSLVELEKTWYARCIYVSPSQAARWRRSMGKKGQARIRQSVAHAQFLTQLADRFFEHAMTDAMGLVTDAKQEGWFDQIFLRELVEQMNASFGGPRYSVYPVDSKDTDLLQVADLLVGSVAQMFHPVPNPNKEELANILRPLADPSVNKIGVWKW